jgi:hypothetical protein
MDSRLHPDFEYRAAISSVPSTKKDSFPVRLHFALTEFEDAGLVDIVSWAPHGRSFAIHKHQAFVEKFLGW